MEPAYQQQADCLAEVIWKIITSIINTHIRVVVSLHDALNVFRQGSGVGTVTLEAKLAHNMYVICHEPLFQLFLDVKNSYYSLDRKCCMYILQGYGIGANLQ